jgi:hypothetical protein
MRSVSQLSLPRLRIRHAHSRSPRQRITDADTIAPHRSRPNLGEHGLPPDTVNLDETFVIFARQLMCRSRGCDSACGLAASARHCTVSEQPLQRFSVNAGVRVLRFCTRNLTWCFRRSPAAFLHGHLLELDALPSICSFITEIVAVSPARDRRKVLEIVRRCSSTKSAVRDDRSEVIVGLSVRIRRVPPPHPRAPSGAGASSSMSLLPLAQASTRQVERYACSTPLFDELSCMLGARSARSPDRAAG